MPPEHADPTRPAAWLRRARSNLARARAGQTAPDVLFEDLCFDAQQAAEKAIKAVLVHHQIPFPKTRQITQLLTLAEQQAVAVPAEVREAATLTQYAVESRYPRFGEEVTREEYDRALVLANVVVRWASDLLGS